MAKPDHSPAESAQAEGLLARLGLKRGRKVVADLAEPSTHITQSDEISFGLGGTTISSLFGGERRQLRDRRTIYTKWADMEADGICSTALGLLTTAALGGHETSGQLVFIEPKASINNDASAKKIVSALQDDLTEIFNSVAFPVCYTACWAGDSYARIYSRKGHGVTGLGLDESWQPQLVQPYERAGRTVGYSVYTGSKNWERLSYLQLARLKMQRTQFVPQHAIVEKALRMNVVEDDPDQAPILPSFAGGSLLYPAENAYDNLNASLIGLVGQRITDSISEEMLGVNLSNMDKDQQNLLMSNVIRMLTTTRDRAMKAIKTGRPIVERLRYLFPTNAEKQLFTISGNGQSRTTPISIEDVMVHARMLSGALGVDLSMIGFADQMAGGLGEGGFFRSSAQVGERARVVRTGANGFFNHVIDVHTALKWGVVFPENQRPWQLNYYGSISALESERQNTRTNGMNSGLLLAQSLDMFKNMGTPVDVMENVLANIMMLDADQAKLLARLMETKRPSDMGEEGGGGQF